MTEDNPTVGLSQYSAGSLAWLLSRLPESRNRILGERPIELGRDGGGDVPTLANINRTKLEAVFHRIFAPAQIERAIKDRFGNPERPKEWFLVPLSVIDDAVRAIRDGSITRKLYDPTTAQLVET